jgi:hypothetical protein
MLCGGYSCILVLWFVAFQRSIRCVWTQVMTPSMSTVDRNGYRDEQDSSVKWAVSAAVKAREFSTSYNILIGNAVLTSGFTALGPLLFDRTAVLLFFDSSF